VPPGCRRHPVGRCLDICPQFLPGGCQRVIGLDQAAGDEAGHGLVPRLAAPSPAGPGEAGQEPLAGRDMGNQCLDAAQPRGHQRRDVTVAAMLAQQ